MNYPIKISEDKEGIRQNLEMHNERIDHFQKVVDKFIELGFKEDLKADDLKEIFSNTKPFLFDKITEKKPFMGELNVDKNSAFDIVEKPTGVLEFIEYIKKEISLESSKSFYVRWAEYYEIKDGKKVVIKPSLEAEIIKSNSIFIKNEKENDFFEALKQVVKSINDLNKVDPVWDIKTTLFEKLIIVDSSGVAKYDIDFLRTIRK